MSASDEFFIREAGLSGCHKFSFSPRVKPMDVNV
ncbi:hypothetical protein RHECNPAF_470072 [Rhizobium etli CNPAF512]|nr:hypothetical protein RHECNPAF_470072 [Rhizobium etli CNPAF512]